MIRLGIGVPKGLTDVGAGRWFLYKGSVGNENEKIGDKRIKAIPKFELKVSKSINWVEKR